MSKQILVTLAGLLLAGALAAAPVLAGEQHSHNAMRGGIVVESGHHHVEIVAKDGTLEVYVAGEDGKPESVQKAKASAAVLSEGKKVDVALTPDPSNVLRGSGSFKAGKGTTIVLTLTMPGHVPEQMRVRLD